MFYAGQATRGLRDREFLQTPRGRIFSLLEFYSRFKCFSMFRLVEAGRGRLIGPKTWDRIVGNFLGFSLLAVTAHKFRGLFGCFNSKNLRFKTCIDMKKAGNGPYDRSENMGPNCGIFLETLWAVRDSPEF